jgi:hypothetical protein
MNSSLNFTNYCTNIHSYGSVRITGVLPKYGTETIGLQDLRKCDVVSC